MTTFVGVKAQFPIILSQIFSGLNLSRTGPWLNHETKVYVRNPTVLMVSDR